MKTLGIIGGKMKVYILGDTAATGSALVALSSYGWWESVKHSLELISAEAAILTPIAALLLIVLQIGSRFLSGNKTQSDE